MHLHEAHVCVYWWRSNLKEIGARRGEASTFSSIKAIIARASLFEQYYEKLARVGNIYIEREFS